MFATSTFECLGCGKRFYGLSVDSADMWEKLKDTPLTALPILPAGFVVTKSNVMHQCRAGRLGAMRCVAVDYSATPPAPGTVPAGRDTDETGIADALNQLTKTFEALMKGIP